MSKRRFGYRGKKQRYSAFRAERNKNWEKFNEEMSRQICIDNGLNIEDYVESDWEKTRDKLEENYRLKSKSISEIFSKIFDEVEGKI